MVDDLLPVTEGNAPYSACAAAGELWALLWEKAYAKLHGGYPALDSIAAPSALMDLTGVRPFEVHFKGRGRDAVTAEPFGGFGLEVDLGTEDGFMASLCRGHRWTACRDDGSGACEVVDCAWVEDGGRRRLLAKLRSCCGSEADRPTAEQVWPDGTGRGDRSVAALGAPSGRRKNFFSGESWGGGGSKSSTQKKSRRVGVSQRVRLRKVLVGGTTRLQKCLGGDKN